MDGVHGGLGARVREPPARQPPAACQLSGHGDRVLCRLREVGTALDLRLDRPDDGGVGVPGEGRAVAAVQVHVLVAVGVVDLAAGAVAEPDRLRLGDLPVRRDAAGQHPGGAVRERGGLRLPLDEDGFLFGDDVGELRVCLGKQCDSSVHVLD